MKKFFIITVLALVSLFSIGCAKRGIVAVQAPSKGVSDLDVITHNDAWEVKYQWGISHPTMEQEEFNPELHNAHYSCIDSSIATRGLNVASVSKYIPGQANKDKYILLTYLEDGLIIEIRDNGEMIYEDETNYDGIDDPCRYYRMKLDEAVSFIINGKQKVKVQKKTDEEESSDAEDEVTEEAKKVAKKVDDAGGKSSDKKAVEAVAPETGDLEGDLEGSSDEDLESSLEDDLTEDLEG